MATMNATVDGWRNRQGAVWYPSSGFSSIGSGTGASLYIASNPGGNNKYTICLRIKTPSATEIGSISKLSVTFKMYKANSNSGTLYGSLRTSYTDSGSGDTASTFRNNAIGNEASKAYSSTSYGTFTFEFSGSFSQGTYYYLFLYTKTTLFMMLSLNSARTSAAGMVRGNCCGLWIKSRLWHTSQLPMRC